MTNIAIDEVLNRLSIKFNRIFYDRDFVGCVSEDLQIIINNKNKCCVLVFPTLSPNYLRVVRYQAKLCDLAIIPICSGSSKSIGVCHKKYFLAATAEEDCKKESLCLCDSQMAENAATVTRKKRPPIQLYVPPAQRKSRLSTPTIAVQKESNKDNTLRNSKISNDYLDKKEKSTTQIRKEASVVESNGNATLEAVDINQLKDICYCTEDIDYYFLKKDLLHFSYQCNCAKIFLFKDLFPYAKLLIFSIRRKKHSFHWIRCHEGDPNVVVDDTKFETWTTLNRFKDISTTSRPSVLVPNPLDFREPQNQSEEYQSEFQNTYCLCGNKMFFYLPDYMYCCYVMLPDFEIFDEGWNPEFYLYCFQDAENGSLYIEEYLKSLTNRIVVYPHKSKTEDIDLDSLLATKNRTESPQMPLQKDISNCDSKLNDVCAKPEITSKRNDPDPPETKPVPKQTDHVIVLEERKESPKMGTKNQPTLKDRSKKNEHEQEKEIMRKAKQNINRKTRPIIKYVDDDNDTLKIGKGDNVNNWEDLFNDEGELQEDIFHGIVQKVGPEVTIVKATEDYSAYASKQVEELEHMVELYDFPSTLETNDLITAFSELNSDSMYVKWVDDTRALLILGSSSQAQKAVELSSPLIKARLMSAASSLALEKANQSDLKPAMKRPQTNLQTARRLITSHLGAKSKVSKEQSAKEREDLRVAKELKKQAKRNERDAWEGNLRSTIN